MREPPNNIVAEQSVLGAMLLSKEAIVDVVEVLSAPDFYRPAHQILFETIIALYGRGEPADSVTVLGELTRAGLLGRTGGGPYLHTLVSTVPTAVGAGYYARQVRDVAVMRRLTEVASRIAHVGYSEMDAESALDLSETLLYDVTDRRTTEDYVAVEDCLQGALDEIEAIGARGGVMSGVPTGFADLDSIMHGLHPGQLIVVAARPAIGKSTLGLDFARTASVRHGIPSAIFSLEMGRAEITMRLLSAEGGVPLANMRSGSMSDEDWGRLARRMGPLSAAPLYMDDSPNLSLPEVRSKARRLHQRHGVRLIIVDYLQLMTGGRKSESRQQEVSEMSRSLKLLAKELEVPVVAISQLNRGVEMRTDKRPQLADLRESGSIEQDADVVILLSREDAYDPEARPGEADFILAKHRNGPTATVTVAFQGHLSRFADMARE